MSLSIVEDLAYLPPLPLLTMPGIKHLLKGVEEEGGEDLTLHFLVFLVVHPGYQEEVVVEEEVVEGAEEDPN